MRRPKNPWVEELLRVGFQFAMLRQALVPAYNAKALNAQAAQPPAAPKLAVVSVPDPDTLWR